MEGTRSPSSQSISTTPKDQEFDNFHPLGNVKKVWSNKKEPLVQLSPYLPARLKLGYFRDENDHTMPRRLFDETHEKPRINTENAASRQRTSLFPANPMEVFDTHYDSNENYARNDRKKYNSGNVYSVTDSEGVIESNADRTGATNKENGTVVGGGCPIVGLTDITPQRDDTHRTQKQLQQANLFDNNNNSNNNNNDNSSNKDSSLSPMVETQEARQFHQPISRYDVSNAQDTRNEDENENENNDNVNDNYQGMTQEDVVKLLEERRKAILLQEQLESMQDQEGMTPPIAFAQQLYANTNNNNNNNNHGNSPYRSRITQKVQSQTQTETIVLPPNRMRNRQRKGKMMERTNRRVKTQEIIDSKYGRVSFTPQQFVDFGNEWIESDENQAKAKQIATIIGIIVIGYIIWCLGNWENVHQHHDDGITDLPDDIVVTAVEETIIVDPFVPSINDDSLRSELTQFNAKFDELSQYYNNLQDKMKESDNKRMEMEKLINDQKNEINNLKKTLETTESRLPPTKFNFNSVISENSPFPYNLPYLTDFILSIYDQSKRVRYNSNGNAQSFFDLSLLQGTFRAKEAISTNQVSITGNEVPNAINIGDCLNFDTKSSNGRGWIELLLRGTIKPSSFEYLHINPAGKNLSPSNISKILGSKPSKFKIYGRLINQAQNANVKIGEANMDVVKNHFVKVNLNAPSPIDIVRVEFENDLPSTEILSLYRMHVRANED